MARIEAYPSERLRMPQPGTLDYFIWLGELNVADHFGDCDARTFLEQTRATKSFISFIRTHRTFVPLRREYRSDLDSRRLQLGPEWESIFQASIETSPDLPNHGMLMLHGQPMPDELPDDNYTYDVWIPVIANNYYAADYDSSRPFQAIYNWLADEDIRRHKSLAYIEGSHSAEYGRNDPAVLISALQEAARDLYGAFHYMYGSREMVSDRTLDDNEWHGWHSDYPTDDPNEFMPKN